MADGPASFPQDSSCPAVLRILPFLQIYTCTGLSPPVVKLSRCVPLHLLSIMSVLQPHSSLNCHGLGSSAFARHYLRNHFCFLLLRVLRCFSSPRSPPPCDGYHAFSVMGSPIRKSPDQRLFAPPRSLSQLTTSFFASESLGIHHTLLVTFLTYLFNRCSRTSKNC